MYKSSNYSKNKYYNQDNTIIYKLVSGNNVPIIKNNLNTNTKTFIPAQTIQNLKDQNIQY